MISGDVAAVIVILLRTLIPLTIFRFPLLGGILAMLADALDVMMFNGFGAGFLDNVPYQIFDKTFDIYYLSIEFFVMRKWVDKLAKKAGSILYSWRLIGFVLFVITGIEEMFLYAPNIFEFFFLAMLIIWKFDKKFRLNGKRLIVILLIVGIPNIIKEYIMHFAFKDQTWDFIRDNFFWWMYN